MTISINFEQFVKNLGFKSYPFNSYTAENEKDKQSELFIATNLYSPFFQAFDAGQTMILCGDRGTGKTSIIYDFIRRSDAQTLIVSIDDFSQLKLNYSATDFYRFVISAIVNQFFNKIANSSVPSRRLTEEERIILTYFYKYFADDSTKGLTKRKAAQIQISPLQKAINGAYKLVRHPLNFFTNLGVSLITDVVAKSLGSANLDVHVREYFPELLIGIESDMPQDEATLGALRQLCKIIQKCSVARIVLLLDKIDEDQRLGNAAEDIADFIRPIVTNNTFLLDESFQVIISSVPRLT